MAGPASLNRETSNYPQVALGCIAAGSIRLETVLKIHIIRIRKFKARITATRLSNVVGYANTTTVHSNEALKHCGEPRATPVLLNRELLPVNCTESYSRSAASRATPSVDGGALVGAV